MSSFSVWIDNPTTQIETLEEFNNEPQRLRGFVAGEKISSKVNNTILRQTSLVTCALMSALEISDVDISSSVLEVASKMKSKLDVKLYRHDVLFYNNSDHSHVYVEFYASSNIFKDSSNSLTTFKNYLSSISAINAINGLHAIYTNSTEGTQQPTIVLYHDGSILDEGLYAVLDGGHWTSMGLYTSMTVFVKEM